MSVVSLNLLLEAGVHFGHQTKRWNPKMKPYIFTARDDIYIIDLQKTADKLEEAYNALKEIAQNGGKVLFVGTRKQAQDAVKEEAERTGSYYVNKRWLGGTLTNFKTIRKRVNRLEEIEKQEKEGLFEVLPKKEVAKIKKEYEKLNDLLSGIRDMTKLPQALYIVDPSKEEIAIREARKLNIPVFGIVDTNCDPDMVDYVIPGNDDAVRAVKLITGVMANAIAEANGEPLTDYTSGKNPETSEDIMAKALETVKKKEDRKGKNNRDFRKKKFNKNRNGKPRDEKKSSDRKPVKEEKPKEDKKEVKTEVKKAVVDYSTKTVSELREIAKDKDIKGYSSMKKAELIKALGD